MIVFDVGANSGADSQAWLARGAFVHAFEPAPQMIDKLRTIHDLIIVEAAVSDYNGTAQFNLAERWDHGCSSLLEFDFAREHWPGRTDLRVTRTIEVPVIRLDTYMREQGIAEVEFLHCDAQGTDLFVLMGLGERYVDVKAGVVEAARNREVALYRDQPLVSDITAWLERHGFTIESITPNDIPKGNEVNVRFRR